MSYTGGMEWFKNFYANDYFKYRYEPRLEEVPALEVDFIYDQGNLAAVHGRRPRVLDICCGIGRHARPLAARDCEVVGVDLSEANIDAAAARARDEGLADRCRFIRDDIRAFEPPGAFDLAINIFTSFGYFESDAADAIVFAKAAASLRPGGRFILDVANREAIIANCKPRERRGRRGNYVIDETSIDLTTSRMTSHWTFVRGKERAEHTIRVRLYALHELIRLGDAHGLTFTAAFGDFDASPHTARSPRCIYVGTKG
ncbi:MAG: class I SAM-dependent methyltransferase [Planctomycetes bacterium]|nr:class I SAM-dependent methyltransferase [Planctomycetota bacterium]